MTENTNIPKIKGGGIVPQGEGLAILKAWPYSNCGMAQGNEPSSKLINFRKKLVRIVTKEEEKE